MVLQFWAVARWAVARWALGTVSGGVGLVYLAQLESCLSIFANIFPGFPFTTGDLMADVATDLFGYFGLSLDPLDITFPKNVCVMDEQMVGGFSRFEEPRPKVFVRSRYSYQNFGKERTTRCPAVQNSRLRPVPNLQFSKFVGRNFPKRLRSSSQRPALPATFLPWNRRTSRRRRRRYRHQTPRASSWKLLLWCLPRIPFH